MTDEEIRELKVELESTKAEMEGLRAEKENLASELETRGAAITELEQVIAALVVQANPDVLDELISGDSVETINQSVEHAQRYIFKVKQGLEAEAARTRVPVGAPQRTTPDLSALSPREKIRYAIGGTK